MAKRLAEVREEGNPLGNELQRGVVTALVKEMTPKQGEATLSTLKKIFDNIVQHPDDDNYRQFKLTSKTFSSIMWSYPAAVIVMKMAGWEEDGDRVRLRNESDAEGILELLEQELQKLRELTPNRPACHEREEVRTDSSSTNSSKCCVLLRKDSIEIKAAIQSGNTHLLIQLLSPYHVTCVKNMEVDGMSIVARAFMGEQIGIARILAIKYGADFSTLNKDGGPDFEHIFDECDSSENCQSLIIQFIKEFNINVHRSFASTFTALHFAVLHKLFTVVKCLVEDYKANVNCASNVLNGTPLHMAYGIGEENIAQYLLDHGAYPDALDRQGNKPIDYKLYESLGSTNDYARLSEYFIKRRVLRKTPWSHPDEYKYYMQLCDQGVEENMAIEQTFNKFPSLKEHLGDISHHQGLEATPTLNALNPYIEEMSTSYYKIGLQLDIVNSKLKIIESYPSLPNHKKKCRKMLNVWLENDISATWKKLCDALKDIKMNTLAERIKNSLQI